MDPLEPLLLPPLLNVISEHAPGISIEGMLPRPEFAQDILSGTVDLACFAYPIASPEISVVPIVPVELVVLARRNHPRIGATLDVETFGKLGFVALVTDLRALTQVDRELLLHGLKRRVVYSVPRVWSMPAIVASTDLVCVLPRHFSEYVADKFDLQIHEPPMKISEQHMYMMWHVKMDDDPGHKWLRETLQAVARGLAGGTDEEMPANVTPFVRPAGGGRRASSAGRPTPPRSA
jgi:DNA-binding transcriptional LysR family regulator